MVPRFFPLFSCARRRLPVRCRNESQNSCVTVEKWLVQSEQFRYRMMPSRARVSCAAICAKADTRPEGAHRLAISLEVVLLWQPLMH
jgi:hypothetical protein